MLWICLQKANQLALPLQLSQLAVRANMPSTGKEGDSSGKDVWRAGLSPQLDVQVSGSEKPHPETYTKLPSDKAIPTVPLGTQSFFLHPLQAPWGCSF